MQSPNQIFLLIDTVGGEGRIDKYAERILIDSFSFSMQAKQNTVRKTDQQASANVDMQAVSVSRPFDTASNALSRMLKNQTKFTEARLTVDQHMTWGMGQEREQNAIIVFHLLNGQVTSQTINAKEGDKGASISETIELSFKNVAIEYYILNRRGGAANRNYRENPVLQFETHLPEHGD
jgi:type VI protein secretion system component Hcp